MVVFSYFILLINVLFRKRAQDKDAVQVAKETKGSKVLHHAQPEKQVEDSGAEKKLKGCKSLKKR